MNDDNVKPVAYVTGYYNGYATVQPLDGAVVLTTGMALYTRPPAADIAELVEARRLEEAIRDCLDNTQELIECLQLVMLEHRTFGVLPEKLYERINTAVTKCNGK
jgi:hypothetical protein